MPVPITFHSKSPDFGWLSNFSLHAFSLDGLRWPSVEHYYQAQKYSDSAVVECIRNAESPLKARKAGQDRSLTHRPDWAEVREEVMRRAVRAKFDQNRVIREKLLATGEEELIHQSSSDSYWGRNRDGVGENRLGVILMAVRQALQALR